LENGALKNEHSRENGALKNEHSRENGALTNEHSRDISSIDHEKWNGHKAKTKPKIHSNLRI
jgi:hypothetical protein